MIRFTYDFSTGVEQRKSFLLRIPLLLPAAALATGIYLADSAPTIAFIFWLIVACMGAAGLGVASIKKRWAAFGIAMAGVAFLGLGGLRFDQSYRSIPDDNIVLFTGESPIFATIQGHVTSYPVVSYPENNFGFKPQPTVKFLFAVDSIKTPDGFASASGLCRVTIREPYHLPDPGDRLELVGSIGRYRRPANPGQGDMLRTARITGTNVWFTVPTYKGAKTLEHVGRSNNWRNALWRVRAFLRQRLTESDDLLSGQLVSALILGERRPACEI